MRLRTLLLFFSISMILVSCWKYQNRGGGGNDPIVYGRAPKVWGYKPVYGNEPQAKQISYSSTPQQAMNAGNIYAFQNYIFQVETGYGIHVIDNTTSSSATRVGFINVKGCSQISIKGDKLYTNSYDDLVVIEFSNLSNIREFSRLIAVFPEYKYDSPISQPPHPGYYECPDYGRFVVGWTMDSVYQSCRKD